MGIFLTKGIEGDGKNFYCIVLIYYLYENAKDILEKFSYSILW